MVLIVGIAFDFPEPFLEGLATTRLVLLSGEGSLVLREGREVLRTNSNGTGYGYEAVTDADFLLRDRRAAGDGTDSAQVQAGTVGVGGRCYTVSGENHFLVGCVRRFLVDFG